MNTTIFLIRHGEIDNPQEIMYGGNIELEMNDKGRGQIKNVAKKIKKAGYKIEKIYTSPMKRTLETAKIIAEEFGLKNKIIIDEKLKDVNIPTFAGKPISIRKKLFKKGTDEYNEKYVKLGNELKESIMKRMMGVFKKAFQKNPGKTVAMISHGDPIRLFLFALEHPSEKIPGMNILINSDYPQKGEAVKIVLDENGKFIKKEFI